MICNLFATDAVYCEIAYACAYLVCKCSVSDDVIAYYKIAYY